MDSTTKHEKTIAAGADERWPRWRTWVIRIWYGALGMWALLMARGVVYLALGRADPGERFAAGSVSAWKLLATGGVLIICWTGGRSVVAFQALVTGWAAWLLSERLIAEPSPDETPVASLVATILLWLLPLVLLRPHRRQLFRVDPRPGAILLPLALAAAVPLVIFAVHHGRLSTGAYGGEFARYDACGLGLVVAVQAVFAALKPRGSAWPARLAGFAGAWIGVLAVVWPGDVTNPGRAWGAALVGWAVLFVATAEVETRRATSAR
jgi:hypothetical protein